MSSNCYIVCVISWIMKEVIFLFSVSLSVFQSFSSWINAHQVLFMLCMRHPSLELSTRWLTLRQKDQTFFLGRCLFFRFLLFDIQLLLYLASLLFGTQQQLTEPPVKSSTLALRKMFVPQDWLLRNILTLYSVVALWFGTHLFHSLKHAWFYTLCCFFLYGKTTVIRNIYLVYF